MTLLAEIKDRLYRNRQRLANGSQRIAKANIIDFQAFQDVNVDSIQNSQNSQVLKSKKSSSELDFDKLQNLLKSHKSEGLAIITDGYGNAWPEYPKDWSVSRILEFQRLFLKSLDFVFDPEFLNKLPKKKLRNNSDFRCYSCGNQSYWLNLAGQKICTKCHPPVK
ncbi:hypothetical protein [Desulfovulcanus sp.]